MNTHEHTHDEHDEPVLSRPKIRAMLRQAGLRPTRQRLALAELLCTAGATATCRPKPCSRKAMLARVPVSLATIYNTLHQFTGAGLLREVAVDGSRTYFDTNISEHHHFFIEDDNEVIDIPPGTIGVGRVPEPPPGFAISRVDVVVRLRRLG